MTGTTPDVTTPRTTRPKRMAGGRFTSTIKGTKSTTTLMIRAEVLDRIRQRCCQSGRSLSEEIDVALGQVLGIPASDTHVPAPVQQQPRRSLKYAIK